jgi:uncharacterized coiled-coil DUF342 family protein
MPPEITLEQEEQLTAWAAKRDAILSEISVLQTQKDKLAIDNKSLADSNSDTEKRINQSIGRMSALDQVESGYEGIVSSQISVLLSEKSGLQSDVTGLKNEIGILVSQKDTLVESISLLKDAYDRVFLRAEVLDKVVDHVTRVSADNLRAMEVSSADFKTTVNEMVGVLNKNIEEANYVITDIPKAFIELNRQRITKHQI